MKEIIRNRKKHQRIEKQHGQEMFSQTQMAAL